MTADPPAARVPAGAGVTTRTDARPGFAAAHDPVDVAVVVVTYQSVDEVGALLASLRAEAESVSLRVVLVDNASTDGTLPAVHSAHPDVITVAAGANLGYAGGINAASDHLGECRAVLVLNPDLVLRPGAIAALLDRLDSAAVGIVVPRILDADGQVYPSLRREPSVRTAIGDALCGARWWTRRPGWFAETVLDPADYAAAHPVDWATGAALLIRASVARAIGPWDERYFLYSEETDYCRRARNAGASIWYEPAATVVHAQGASGSSDRLTALSAVNRIRYMRKFHPTVHAAAFHAVVVLAEALRAGSPAHRRALRAVLTPWTWSDLARPPGDTGHIVLGYLVPEFPGQTHGFFWREFTALSRAGGRPVLVSTRRPGGTARGHAWAPAAAGQTRYLTDWSGSAAVGTAAVLARAALGGRRREVVAELRAVAVDTGALRAWGLLLAGARLAALARREHWRHVHVHSCAGAAQVATFAHVLRGLPYSVSLHGPLADYGGNQRGKWRRASFGLVITDDLRREVLGALGTDLPPTIAVAPMGISPDRLVRATPYVPWAAPAPLRVFSCGRLNASKGHIDLVHAVGALTEAGRDVQLVIAGEDEHRGAGYRIELEALIARSGVGDRVRLLGTVDEDEVRTQLERAHVFALASHAEPLGVAIMEAMALQVPVVVCAGGGVRALVRDGETGLLATPLDPSSIAAALARVADDPDLAVALGDRGRRHVVSAFSSESSAHTLLDLVERSAAAGSPR